MFPFFNSGSVNSDGNPPSAAMKQVMVNPGNFPPNPLQFQQQTMGPQTNMPFNYPIFPFQQAPINFNQISQNPSQFLNQNPYLGLGFPNQMQGVNQFFQMPMSNFSGQVFPGSTNMPQNLAFDANTLMGFGYNDGRTQLSMNPSVPNQMLTATQQNTGVHPFVPLPLQKSIINLHSAAGQSQVILQPFVPLPLQKSIINLHSAAGQSQGNSTNPPQGPKNHIGESHHNKSFARNPKQQGSQSRFVKQQGKRNSKFQKFQSKAGNDDQGETSIAKSLKTNQAEKRTISLNYTEQEIKQWREERQKNYPTKDTVEKKLKENQKDPEISRKNASLRCQLKEILAKQAELGCEVAEIPSSYLSDPQAVHGSKDTGRAFNENDKFNRRVRFKQNHDFPKNGLSLEQNSCGTYSRDNDQNDHLSNNRGPNSHNPSHKYRQNYQSAKKQGSVNGDRVSHYAENKREPTLLRKLLRSDIRKDKRQLLQVFRFMVMNSFFKDCPEKPLKFPQVLLREIGNEDEYNQSNFVGRNESILGETEECVENDVDFDRNKENPDSIAHGVVTDEKDCGIQEEGEITD